MPTGYTQILYDNPSMPLEKWAFHCARAFGVAIAMRDDDPNLPVPKKMKPDLSYHKKSIRNAQATIRKLEKMTPVQVERYNAKKRKEFRKHCEEEIKKNKEAEEALSGMKAQLENWNPPAEYAEFKRFMGNQIEISTPYGNYYVEALTKVDKTDYWSNDLAKAHRDIPYHTEGIAKEIKTTETRNKWLEGLQKSLKK